MGDELTQHHGTFELHAKGQSTFSCSCGHRAYGELDGVTTIAIGHLKTVNDQLSEFK